MIARWLFWISQHWFPLFLTLTPPILLWANQDFLGGWEGLATGALSILAVLLLFAAAYEIIRAMGNGPNTEARDLVALTYLFAGLLLAVCTVATVWYVLAFQLPAHRDQLDEETAFNAAAAFGIASFLFYLLGCTIAVTARRLASRLA